MKKPSEIAETLTWDYRENHQSWSWQKLNGKIAKAIQAERDARLPSEKIKNDIVRSVCEIPYPANPDQDDAVCILVDELEGIIENVLRDNMQAAPALPDKFKIVGDDVSDGYHTFTELYEHRCLLFVNLVLMQPEKGYWREGFEGWPLIGLETSAGQVSYHVPERMLPLVKDRVKHGGPEWDNHTSDDVVERLLAVARQAAPDARVPSERVQVCTERVLKYARVIQAGFDEGISAVPDSCVARHLKQSLEILDAALKDESNTERPLKEDDYVCIVDGVKFTAEQIRQMARHS